MRYDQHQVACGCVVIKLCRFAPGELDPYDPTIRRLPTDVPIPR